MPLSRRQILRRRRVTVFGGLALVLGTGFYLPLTLLAPLEPVAASIAPYESPVQEELELSFPTFGSTAVGAIGFPGTLAQSGDEKPVAIASITKVITVLVVLDAKPLAVDEKGPSIAMTQADVALWNKQVAQNGSVAPVSAGISLTERELMDLILVKSANNYAETLVNWAFGSEKAYLPIARDWLRENNLDDTSLADSTGFSPANRSTAVDLVELGKIALANPVVSAIVDTKKETVPHIGTIENTNELLGVAGIRGIKTGTTEDAGACLLFAADYAIGDQTVTVIGVMLGGDTHPQLNERIKKLLKTVKASFHEVTLTTQGQTFASYSTAWGDTASAVAASDTTALVFGQTPVTLLVNTDEIGTAEKGTDVGDLTFAVGEATVVVQLELTKTIDDPGAWWRLTNPADLF
jgi:D-alanyl-D-alanine carboxypeptidase (penicillin-binding protein 5/6)